MSDFPNTQWIGPVLSCESLYSMGGRMFSHTINTVGSGGWAGANIAVFIPFSLPCPFKMVSMFCVNGTSVTGNIDLGVYALDGTLIVSSGAVAQAGTSTLQIVSIAETLLAPGAYYMAVSASSGSATATRHGYGTAGLAVAGVVRAASCHPLTTLPTFASHAGGVTPIMGIASITTY